MRSHRQSDSGLYTARADTTGPLLSIVVYFSIQISFPEYPLAQAS